MQASADSAAAAAQHETTAAATPPHWRPCRRRRTGRQPRDSRGVVGNEFLWINTIPITLNEADYVRMWFRRYHDEHYQAVSSAALASTPALRRHVDREI